jgi:hypothetical protein
MGLFFKGGLMKSFLIIALGLCFLSSCAISAPPNLAVKPNQTFKFTKEEEGLTISIDPFFENERLRNYFGTNLLSYGILPVLVVAENHNPNTGFLLEKNQVSLVNKKDITTGTQSSPPVVPPKGGVLPEVVTSVAFSPTILILPPAAIIPIIMAGGFVEKQKADIRIINDNLTKKEFVDKSLFPGELHSGFVYFQIKDKDMTTDIKQVLVKIKNMLSGKEIIFSYDIM